METILDSEGIKKLLPHRYPFLWSIGIIELAPLQRIVGIKQVSINESFFQGHFPGAPRDAGVLVIEALAQCGAILALREIAAIAIRSCGFHEHQGSALSAAGRSGRHSSLEVTALRFGPRIQSHAR